MWAAGMLLISSWLVPLISVPAESGTLSPFRSSGSPSSFMSRYMSAEAEPPAAKSRVTDISPTSAASTRNQSWSPLGSVRPSSVTEPTSPRSVRMPPRLASPETMITARKIESSSEGLAVSSTISRSPLLRKGARL